jgi:PPOX class probable F420-dependent enzyme
MTPGDARRRFAEGRVARLATVRADGAPHLVPIVFALDGDRLVFAVDEKAKRERYLRRLDNIAREPRVSILVDRYDERWDELWWVRADGRARVLDDPDDERAAIDLLASKYEQYRRERPRGPAVAVEIDGWGSWSQR